MPLEKNEQKGTNKDGSISEKYCVYCLKDGNFLQDITLEEAIAQSGDYAEMAGVTKPA